MKRPVRCVAGTC